MERPGSTLIDIEPLLSRQDATFRNEIIARSRDEQTIRFFRDSYPSFPKDAHLPITTRISRLVRPKAVRSLLCQPGRSFNFREAMDEGKILLFNLSDGLLGEQTSQLLGQLIVSKMQMAVMSRMDTPAALRRPFYLYLDEFQTFTGVAETSYANMLSRARKYKLGLILAHQQTGQLSQDLLRDILGNVSTLITFNVSHEDAVKLSKEYVQGNGQAMEYMPPGELLSLKTGEAWGKIGKSCFFLSTALAPQQPDLSRAKEVIQRSRKNYGVGSRWDGEVKRPPQNAPKMIPVTATEEPLDPSKVF
jgi:Type IV secretion-system coupling protein DNA-binding domain